MSARICSRGAHVLAACMGIVFLLLILGLKVCKVCCPPVSRNRLKKSISSFNFTSAACTASCNNPSSVHLFLSQHTFLLTQRFLPAFPALCLAALLPQQQLPWPLLAALLALQMVVRLLLHCAFSALLFYYQADLSRPLLLQLRASCSLPLSENEGLRHSDGL